MKIQLYPDGRVCMILEGEYRDLRALKAIEFMTTLALMLGKLHAGKIAESAVNAYMIEVWESAR